MEQIKPVAELTIEDTLEQQEAAMPTGLRTLSELELALTGGGDGHINW